jgi:hypothetical protein
MPGGDMLRVISVIIIVACIALGIASFVLYFRYSITDRQVWGMMGIDVGLLIASFVTYRAWWLSQGVGRSEDAGAFEVIFNDRKAK